MIDSIIFDLDGTLWDTRKETMEAVNKIVEKYNIDEISEEVINNAMGHTDEEVSEMYFPNLKKEYRYNIFKELDRENIKYLKTHGGILYPKVKETLEFLSSKYKLFIVSNCGAGYIESFLDYYKFNNLFADFIAASKENISKTAAINKLKETHSLSFPVYVGDTLGDYNYAKGANILFIHAKYGFNPEIDCKYKINNFEELTSYLENIKGDDINE